MNDLERSLAFVASTEEIAFLKSIPQQKLIRISVVIPSFNQSKFLAQTLDSVLAQDYPNIEVFVADGGSSDDSVRILEDYAKQYPNSVRYDSRPDGGHYRGVNKGIANTTGEIIAWINSDDLYLPETFWKIAAFFYYNRSALVVYGRNTYVNERLDTVTEYPVDWSPLLAEQKRRMMHFCIVPQPSLFFRREAILMCGALASEILDYELWLRWQINLPFYFYDDHLSLSRLHQDAITAKAGNQLLRGICQIVHQYYGAVPCSWAFKYASTVVNGSGWTRGESVNSGLNVRVRACWYWLWLNIRWSPRLIYRLTKDLITRIRQLQRISA